MRFFSNTTLENELCRTKKGMNLNAFGMEMPGRNFTSNAYRFGFNGQEKDDEWTGVTGSHLNFGNRIYDSRTGRWYSVDPAAAQYPGWSPYAFVRNNPILRIDPSGLWDVTVHAYTDRAKYGYGVAILKNRNGEEIARYVVRLEGQTHNRMTTGGDTPTGVYDIPETGTWMSTNPETFGPNPRLVLNPQSGEIVTSSRSDIRFHGGRQGENDYKQEPNEPLQKTRGCVRWYDADIGDLKTQTDLLEANDALEIPGAATISNDLMEFRGSYYTPEDYNQIQQNIGSSTNITGGLLNAISLEQMRNILNSNIGSYQEGIEGATQGVEGISPTKKDFE